MSQFSLFPIQKPSVQYPAFSTWEEVLMIFVFHTKTRTYFHKVHMYPIVKIIFKLKYLKYSNNLHDLRHMYTIYDCHLQSGFTIYLLTGKRFYSAI